MGQRVLFSGGGPDKSRDVYAKHLEADQGRVISFHLSQKDELIVLASSGADIKYVKEQMGNLKEFISKVLPRRPTTGAGSASSSSQAVFRDGQNRKEVLAMPMDAAFKLVHKFLVKDLGPLLDAAEPVPDTSAAAMEADAVESGTGELHDVLAGAT